MCGIVGYAGQGNAFTILRNGLKKLEYRGYDSAGIATIGSGMRFVKDTGRVDSVLKGSLGGKVGVAHTRWATHGGVTRENAHPHFDCAMKVAVVHNGIIENYRELKRELEERGHRFRSETDTEVIAHLIEENLQEGSFEAFKRAVSILKGSYALAVLTEPEEKVYIARMKSPLVIGVGEGEMFIASDFTAFLDRTRRVVFVEDGEVGYITRNGFYLEKEGVPVERKPVTVDWKAQDTSRKGFTHFMLKEIYEGPEAVEKTVRAGVDALAAEIERMDGINIVAAGTSYHAGMAFMYASSMDVRPLLASEFSSLYRGGDLLAISQSGETADTLQAVRSVNARVISIVNVAGSTLSRIARFSFQTKAGPEVGVAATKTFLAQLAALFSANSILEGEKLPEFNLKPALKLDNEMRKLAAELTQKKNMFYIGRDASYVTAMEGALKMKEIAYIHAEAYAGGELKHGPLALIEEGVPVVAICPGDRWHDKMLGNIAEVKARGGLVIAFGEKGDRELKSVADRFYGLDPIDPRYSPILYTIPLQLLAYHTAVFLGRDPDKPRNLAKSVTVE